ncbi:hypothetical protein HPB50_024038 [Hyalomma asiaticum]|uniref:Uncharacterized protein n=1 Tax=Hyalomma asiaticum TaxID=266040 RepID=A0ACB7T3S9_HYAAI|nr:hypothetical protein HPB50_024038 [Hyalomma asiaticum]
MRNRFRGLQCALDDDADPAAVQGMPLVGGSHVGYEPARVVTLSAPLNRLCGRSTVNRRAGTMMNFCWALVTVAAVIVRDQDMLSSIGDQLNLTLKTGLICDAIPDDASSIWAYRIQNKNNWHGGWWSWFELYTGRFTCSDAGLGMIGNCDHNPFVNYHANCYIKFTGLRTSCKLRVAANHPRHVGAFAVIYAGHVNATVDVPHATLELGRDHMNNRLHITDFDPDYPHIKELVFENSTITWQGKEIDTNDHSFQELVREALFELAELYIMGPFLVRMKEALQDASNKTSAESQPY